MPRRDGTGPRGMGPGTGKGGTGQSGATRGRMGGRGIGASDECQCPKCGTKAPHRRGTPCFEQLCPQCGAVMTRAS